MFLADFGGGAGGLGGGFMTIVNLIQWVGTALVILFVLLTLIRHGTKSLSDTSRKGTYEEHTVVPKAIWYYIVQAGVIIGVIWLIVPILKTIIGIVNWVFGLFV